ncbi:MAG: tRNA guanosine(34) transglycosylase Tgt [Candidatus Bipolaricaulota bacterium]
MALFQVGEPGGGCEGRLGVLCTPHGAIHTPAFVAVATRAAVRAVSLQDLELLEVQALIGNTYHLVLRPGPEMVSALGGLHGFSGWNGPWMTDSGGFQVFSLGAGKEHGVGKVASVFSGESKPRPQGKSLVRLTEEGVVFRSVLDGSWITFTPESVIHAQRLLGADLVLPLDECTSPWHSKEYTEAACERTHRWAERALATWQETAHSGPNTGQTLYGIVQGGAYEDLRRRSARLIAGLGFPGAAIGGSLGKSRSEMLQVLEWVNGELPGKLPRHLLGIGTLEDLVEAVRRGVDTFDCAAPMRMARNGTLLTLSEPGGRLGIRAARFRRDNRAVDPACDCPSCSRHSRAYLHHLLRSGELTYYRLATLHNLRTMVRFMAGIRAVLAAGRTPDVKDLLPPG